MEFAIIGWGFIADSYLRTTGNHPGIRFVGAWDQHEGNLDVFSRRWGGRRYTSMEELLADESVSIVLNLTNPRSHFDVTKRCLLSGKNVYSEKPLGMTLAEAQELADLASEKNLMLSSAPCSVLGESAQTLWKAVREQAVGRIRLVYANFDDGMIAPRMSPWTWLNSYGVPWPAKDEFEVGCTYEHAGYVLTWLAAIFGPALSVTSFASCQIPEKGIPVDMMAPDFTVGCLEYANGVVARVTCGLVAPRDKSITMIGDDGVLFVGNVRNDAGPVMVRKNSLSRWQSAIDRRIRWLHRWLESRIPWGGGDTLFQSQYPHVRRPRGTVVGAVKPVDFLRGPAEMADAIRLKLPSRLSAELGVHIVEILEALQFPEQFGYRKTLTTKFEKIHPMEWAL